ncbi:hypothetical protein THER_0128 [Thermodesulfovibrio sp. N1]|uniref:DUF5320 domain-containing protein n=1 Tax=unclassified Thermodesulfovibrio TaxID=2645936 RepID=UPI00083A1AD0|nr:MULTISPECIES: DUF5320 domain-containing protein [unclassified Thermodesulfovibrio]MDI1471990.1 DUF5320 domain-containing protein [Thermodesulfovibrio sp. 1176]ODA45253.1 hypothetical protein THER_0128 [Thermodesulfovibrio sp. N1]
MLCCDRTGPFGAGPKTGRGFGYCGRFNASGYMNSEPGRSLGRVRGWRCSGLFRGLRRRFRGFWRMPFFEEAPFREEAELLKQEAEILRKNLEIVEKRLSEIEKEK